jgi:hypothetical protein
LMLRRSTAGQGHDPSRGHGCTPRSALRCQRRHRSPRRSR